MGRWFVNPRKRKGGGRTRRPRVRVSGRTFVLGSRSPFKGRISRVNPIIRNPFIREVGMLRNPRRRRRYRRNPIIRNPGSVSLGGVVRNPVDSLLAGLTVAGAAYLTVGIPNMFGLFQGPDLFSKLLRGGTRVIVGGVLYGFGKRFVPRQQAALGAGVALGSLGATALDLLGTRLIVGAGDTTQTPMTLFSSISLPGFSGYGAYTRPMGAYTRPMGGFRGIYGGNSMGMTKAASGIY
jgi:hypothetical protein